jgi:uncharacterized membrane protein YcaP (DUF421 family)
MEPELKAFLAAIVQIISMLVLWMLVNIYIGIKHGLLFLDGKITIWHGVYYAFLIASFIWVVRFIIRKWKNAPKF